MYVYACACVCVCGGGGHLCVCVCVYVCSGVVRAHVYACMRVCARCFIAVCCSHRPTTAHKLSKILLMNMGNLL